MMADSNSGKKSPKKLSRVTTIAGMTTIGPTRPSHEDAIMVAGMVGISSDSVLRWRGSAECVSAAVVDGLGGYDGGAAASAIIATTLCHVSVKDDASYMNELVEDISRRVMLAGQAWGTPLMGAAMAMISVYQDNVVIANVGDSRVYRFVGNNLGVISVDDRVDANSPGLSQVIGGDSSLDAHVWKMDLTEPHHRFVLCTDGLWSALGDEKLEEFCKPSGLSFGDLYDAMNQAIQACYEAQASDNCSIVVVDVTKAAKNE